MERPALLAELERRAAAFDPERRWVDGSRRTLSDRVWQGGQGVRRQIDDLLREAIRTGEDALVTAGALNPFARGLRWNLSGRHVKGDECDGFATRDVGLGSGVYPFDRLPRLPAHSMCLCYWTQEVTEDAGAVVSILRARYGLEPRPADRQAATPERRGSLAAAARRVARAIAAATGFGAEAA